jgi:hypothetical protein
MFSKKFLILLLICFICVPSYTQEEEENEAAPAVVSITSSNINELGKASKILVILFQNEGKESAKNLKELEDLASKSSSDSGAVAFTAGYWALGITEEIKNRFNLNKLPAVRVLINNEQVEDYKSFIDSDKILSFLKRNFRKWTNQILSVEKIQDLEGLANTNIITLVFFGSPETHNKELELYKGLFKKFNHLAGFANTNSKEIFDNFNVTTTPSLLFLNRKEIDTLSFFELSWDTKSLELFFNTYAFKPLIFVREDSDYEALFSEQDDMLIYARLGPVGII